MLMASDKSGNLSEVRQAVEPQMRHSELQRQHETWPFKGWYAVIVKANREQDAADGFRRENILSYWPNYQKRVGTSRRPNGCRGQRHMFAPIIPGMIFSPIADLSLFWVAIERVPHVVNMLRAEAGKPATLTNADIEIIRLIEAGQNVPPPMTPAHPYKVGDKVRFVDDLMSAWPSGKVTKLSSEGRISVEVYLMERMVPITVLPHQLGRM